MSFLRKYIRVILKEEFFYYGPGESPLKKIKRSTFVKSKIKKEDEARDFAEKWLSSLERKLNFEFSSDIERHIKQNSVSIYPKLLKVAENSEDALDLLHDELDKKFKEPLKKIANKSLKEVAGDYKMAGTRRMDSPGNIRSGFQIIGNRGSIENDLSSEENKISQDRSVLPAAAVTFLSRGGKVLSVSRGNDLTNLNMPGGGIEPNENPKDAAIRELQEETGLIARDAIPLGSIVDNGRVIHLFRVTSWTGKLTPSSEGVPSWEDPEILLKSEFGRTFNRVLEILSGDVMSKKK